MKVTRLTPPPPPQVEFQLTVTAEELAVIKMAVGRVSGAANRAAGIHQAIKIGLPKRISSLDVFPCVGSSVEHITDGQLATAAKIIAEAN